MKLWILWMVFVALLPFLCDQGCEADLVHTVKGLIKDLRFKTHILVGGLLLKKALVLKDKIKNKYLLLKKALIVKHLLGKRSIDTSEEEAMAEEQEFKRLMIEALSVDESACLPRAICEVTARGKSGATHPSNDFERVILEYYGEEPPTSRVMDQMSSPFDPSYAAYLGQYSKDSAACTKAFPQCSESSESLRRLLQEAFNNEICS